jgi:glycerophosphoryl diester phosphodiesterase
MEAQVPLISFYAQNLKRLRDLHAWIPLGLVLSQARDLPAIQTATAGAAFVPLSALADSSLNPLEEGGGIRIGVWTIANESQARLAVSREVRWLVSDLPLTGLN